MRMPDDYQIPDDPNTGRMDAAYLRTCLGIPTPLSGAPPEFSLAIRQAHFHVARALNRLGARGPTGMDATQIAFVYALAIMMTSGEEGIPEEKAPERTFMDDFKEGRVDYGNKVVIRYRAEDHPGHLLRIEGDTIIVLHGGNERKCRLSQVRVPQDGEFSDTADSISETVA